VAILGLNRSSLRQLAITDDRDLYWESCGGFF
jgi:hypothetical protein